MSWFSNITSLLTPSSSSPSINTTDLNTLISLGFTTQAASTVLLYKDNNLSETMEFLLSLNDNEIILLNNGNTIQDLLNYKRKNLIESENKFKSISSISNDLDIILPSELPERFCSFQRSNSTVFVILREIKDDIALIEFSDLVTQYIPVKNIKIDIIPPDEILSHYGYPTRAEIIKVRNMNNKITTSNNELPKVITSPVDIAISNKDLQMQIDNILDKPYCPPPVENFELNNYIDVKDTIGKWIRSQIILVDNITRIKIHYLQWDSKYDEWLDLKDINSLSRITMFNTMADGKIEDNPFKQNDKVKVYFMRDFYAGFYEGYVMKIDGEQILVRFSTSTRDFNYWYHRLDTFSIKPVYKDIVDNSLQFSKVDEFQTEIPTDSSDHSPWAVGNLVEVKAHNNKWFTAVVINKTKDSNGITIKIKAHIIDTPKSCDNWIDLVLESSILRVLGSGIEISDVEKQIMKVEKQFRDELASKGLSVINMEKDGNCLFRSFAYFIYGDSNMHLKVRKECYDYMIQEKVFFEQFADNALESYIDKQRLPNIWGDEIEILALAERYNKKVQIYSLGRPPRCFFESEETVEIETVLLSFHGNNHYNALTLIGKSSRIPLGDGANNSLRLRDIRIKENKKIHSALVLNERVIKLLWNSVDILNKGLNIQYIDLIVSTAVDNLIHKLEDFDSVLLSKYEYELSIGNIHLERPVMSINPFIKKNIRDGEVKLVNLLLSNGFKDIPENVITFPLFEKNFHFIVEHVNSYLNIPN